MTARAILAGVAAALVLPGLTGAAVRPRVSLPSPRVALSVSPPLLGQAPNFEVRFPGRITSAQRVVVGVDGTGRPTSVTDTQRLILRGAGDYTFSVQGPFLDVTPGPGTQSDPGFRKGSIVWLGFSPGRRVLAARAVLDVRRSAPFLPLRVRLATTVAGRPLPAGGRRNGPLDLRLSVLNATSVSAQAFAAEGDPLELAAALDRTRRALAAGRDVFEPQVSLLGRHRARRVRVDAPFEVEGELRFAGGAIDGLRVSGASLTRAGGAVRIRFARVLGDGRPLRLDVRVTGRARGLRPPVLSLRAVPLLRLRSLEPPGGEDWRSAVRRGLVPRPGTRLLAIGVSAFLRLARASQYLVFLTNPDGSAPLQANTAVYQYVTRIAVAPQPAPAPTGSGLGQLATAAIALAAVLAGGGLLVLWAHS